jgi:hypothetical protein
MSTGILSPIKIRPDVGAALAARPADEARLDVGQPDIIGPSIPADHDRVAAAIVGAIDHEAAHAHVAHLREGDFQRSHQITEAIAAAADKPAEIA